MIIKCKKIMADRKLLNAISMKVGHTMQYVIVINLKTDG